MFRGDTAHSGVYSAADRHSYAGMRWSVRLDGPVRGSPVTTGAYIYVGTARGTLVALDRGTGELRWRYDAGASIGATPAVASGLVVIAGADGRVHALDARTGAVRWRTAPTRDLPFPWGHESGDLYLSSPVVAYESVFIGNGDGAIYRLALSNGNIEWRFQTGAPVRSSPAFGDGTVYAGSADGSVYAIDAVSGKQRWRFDTEGRGLVSREFGFDRRTVQSSPALDAGTLYVGARDGFLYAIDRASGALRWRYDHKVSWINASPALAGGLVYAGSSDGHFEQAVDAATGVERWRTPTQLVVWGSAAVVGQTLYVGEANGTFYALDAGTGAARWQWRAGGRIYGSAALADSTIYIGADDGTLNALVTRAGPALDRAVFWDSTLISQTSFAPHAVVRTALEQRGYRLLSAAALASFLGRAADSVAHSTVVFAMDALPRGADSLLAHYLARGGRVVWLGVPPFLWPPDPATGARTLKSIDRPGTERALGVSHRHGNFDSHGGTPTDAGKRIGLEGWLLYNWSADTTGVTVLARDTDGRAAAWRKGGFVRLLGGSWRDGLEPQLIRAIQLAAELVDLP
jgi:outer membrane protein assembly factor BamB